MMHGYHRSVASNNPKFLKGIFCLTVSMVWLFVASKPILNPIFWGGTKRQENSRQENFKSIYIKVYPNISEIYEGIQHEHRIPSGSRPGLSQAACGPGSACARPRAWAGLGPGRRPLGILHLFWMCWLYLGYIWIYFCYNFWADLGPVCINL